MCTQGCQLLILKWGLPELEWGTIGEQYFYHGVHRW
ncbi:unnamed protein product, partial [Rotaria sp. Silwood2]